jgi:tetratricopeptide (TPR) repeat protein
MPRPARELAGKVVILEAPAGTARRTLLQQCLQEAEQTLDAATWLLACNFSVGGAWAGLQDLLAAAVSQMEQQDPELLSAHSYELCLAAPSLRRRISVQHPTLTELAQGHERVRNYPADRAYRSLHGLIDFLDTWRQAGPQNPLVIACDQFDQSSPLVQRFFTECVRRCADRWQLTLLLAVAPGKAEQIASQFPSQTARSIVQLPLPPDPPQSVTHEQVLAEAQHLQKQVEDDPAVADIATPRLIDLWEQAGDTQAALRWQIQAMHRFNQLGLYGAGFRYCPAIEARLDEIRQHDFPLYSTAVISLYFCYLTLGHVEQAYTLITEKVIDQIHAQPSRSHNYYLLAMLYARFLPNRDLPKAVECLEYGLSLLASAQLTDTVRYFYIVFLKNGLAYIRAQQKRPAEAVALCQEGLQLLDRYLAPEQHRLHRSVLVYNIAQVYAATGQSEQALEAFSMVIAMDPYYSEYYNERGAIFFKDGNLRAAERDYLRAIELSPPYPEVWINLGQCYREMERREDAIAAYTRALDLDSQAALPLVGRAEMYAECDQPEQALQDYDAALHLEPQQPLVLAARAVVHYEIGQLPQALNDLDAAIALAPEQALFYHNRATALTDLKRFREATRDLERYLQLQPDAEDRSEIEQKLSALGVAQE